LRQPIRRRSPTRRSARPRRGSSPRRLAGSSRHAEPTEAARDGRTCRSRRKAFFPLVFFDVAQIEVRSSSGGAVDFGSHSSLKRYLFPLPVNVDNELDRLYGLPLDQFTESRDTRAKELRSGGEREAADHVKQARKPTVAAWAANQLARNERMNVRALLTAGEQLREGQAALMRGGKPDELRRAEESERRALSALMDAGRHLVDGEATLRKLEATLRAAAVEPEARDLLERGRVTKDLVPSGFGLAGMPPPTGKRRAPSKKKENGAATERDRRRLAEAREKLQEARKRAREAEREADRARKELARAEEQVTQLQRSNR